MTGILLGQRVGAPTDELDKLSVEELFGIQVTSVGRKAQQLSKAPAAVFVLTSEDIRRSGASSIPEALQWVPGLTVLRLDGRSWVVSARGAARLYSDKILVMIDGRSLYNPLYSGVIWDAVDVLMEDVERIEIVRGPGAVMWGPNAVNAVINIITKRAQSTKGGMTSGGVGSEQRGAAAARAGVAVSDHLAYRVWGKTDLDMPAYGSPGYYHFGNGLIDKVPSLGNLDFATTRLGFRIDGQKGEHDTWMLQGDAFKTNRQDPNAYAVLLPTQVDLTQSHTDYQGGFIQARWTHSVSDRKETVLQFSYDRNNLDYPYAYGEMNNLTLDFQKRAPLSENHDFYWGVGYQQYWDSIQSRFLLGFNPANSVYRVGDVVARDEWQIVPQRLMASAGVRLDYNSYRHLEYQPSVRLLYTPSPRESVWFALSRAIRSPSRADRDIELNDGAVATPLGIPLTLNVAGSKSIQSEVEKGVEFGYRRQSGQRWSVDVSTFWNYYDRLRGLQMPLLPSFAVVGGKLELVQAMTETNAGTGRNYGGEIWAYWQASSTWRITPSYSYLNEARWLPPAGATMYLWDGRPSTLRHQGFLRSQHDIAKNLQFDLMVRARSRDLSWDLPGAVLVDARLGWRATHTGELSVSVHDLTDRKVLESYSEGPTPAIPTRRTFQIKWTQHF